MRSVIASLVVALSASVIALAIVPVAVADQSVDAALPDRDGPTVRDVADPRLAESLQRVRTAETGIILAGRLLQSSSRPAPPGTGAVVVEEWFVEAADGRVLAIAVPLQELERTTLGGEGRRGRRVEVRAVPVGTLEATSRDGEVRAWPLLVGRPVPTAGVSTGAVAVIAATLLAAGGWFILRKRLAGRLPAIEPPTRPHAEDGEPPMDLPKDPADALAVLATRAGDRETES